MNPVLAQNMGRWAEVYFTSPPEKREQAVQELVRELEAENLRRRSMESSIPEELSGSACLSCGHRNPAQQRFCGMCGLPLGSETTATDEARRDSELRPFAPAPITENRIPRDAEVQPREREIPVAILSEARNESSPELESSRNPLSINPFSRDPILVDERSVDDLSSEEDARRPANSLPPREHGFNHDYEVFRVHSFDPVPESSAHPYRTYVGAVLAIVILVLGYMAWRGERDRSASSLPPVAPAASPQAAPALPDPVKSAAGNSAATGAADHTPPPGAETQDAKLDARPIGTGVSVPPAEKAAAVEKIPQTQSAFGTGSEELSMARSYLNGADGHPRDSVQAADWLWKAVAKQNAQATLMLSDLYLKGDGVAKNCDQARVLLDAAARKGMKDAADRLQHMQAFDCD